MIEITGTVGTTLKQRLFQLGCQLLLFNLIYSSANWRSETLQLNQSFILPLDNTIPFVPWMLILYACSILFFVGAFISATTHAELVRLSQRIMLATLIAGSCFYLYPLSFNFSPQEIPFPWDKGFAFLHFIDRPYNQLPSLHVVYSVIFLAHFWRRCWGMTRLLLSFALCMVIISTLFTYQHHLIDVIAGFVVAGGILWLTRTRIYAGIPFTYTGLAVTCLLLGAIFDHILPSSYLSLCFLCIAIAYNQANARFFGKNGEGKLTPLKQFICAPYLAVYWLMWGLQVYFNTTPIRTLSPWLRVGRRLTEKELNSLEPGTVVIDLSAEMPATNRDKKEQRIITYFSYPILDLAPITAQQALEVCQLIDDIRREYPEKTLYLHCTMGLSRSFAVAACYLVWCRQRQAREVKPWLLQCYPHIKLSDNYLPVELLIMLQTRSVSPHSLMQGKNG